MFSEKVVDYQWALLIVSSRRLQWSDIHLMDNWAVYT